MATVLISQEAPLTPPDEWPGVSVRAYAVEAGHLTLPERFFVHPASDDARMTVPSLAFLIEHEVYGEGRPTRIVFDLGLRGRVENYPKPIQQHIKTRQPLKTQPDVVASLAKGGLKPDDIDLVIFSHIHWDHIGEPRHFTKSTFIVGNGSLRLIDGSASQSLRGSHSFFEQGLLPLERTIELSNPASTATTKAVPSIEESLPKPGKPCFQQAWRPHGILPRTLDIFNDGSVLLVDAPGHLPGHLNLLLRTSPSISLYLAGDSCHDRRILRKEREIGEWKDDEEHVCCIHSDKAAAERTIEMIRQLEAQGVEVIFAHDVEWEENPSNAERFFGAKDRPTDRQTDR